MLRKVLGFLAPTIELEDSLIFGAFALGYVPRSIFKPTIATIGTASLIRPMTEENCSAKQGFGFLGWIPGGLAVAAGFFLEGAAVPTTFTLALGSGFLVFSGEMLYKYCATSEFTSQDAWECAFKGLKTAGMIGSLQIGGSGKIMELIEAGLPITWPQAACAAGAAVISARNSLKGYSIFAKSVCGPEEKKPVGNTDYQSLPLDEIQITEYKPIGLGAPSS